MKGKEAHIHATSLHQNKTVRKTTTVCECNWLQYAYTTQKKTETKCIWKNKANIEMERNIECYDIQLAWAAAAPLAVKTSATNSKPAAILIIKKNSIHNLKWNYFLNKNNTHKIDNNRCLPDAIDANSPKITPIENQISKKLL